MPSRPPRPARRTNRTRAAALTTGLALLLTGCFGKPETPADPTTSAPTTASPAAAMTTPGSTAASGSDGPDGSATPPAVSASASGAYVPASEKGPAQNVPKPVMPEAMKHEDQAGAEAAVRYFWETVYYMQQTGDTSLVAQASTDQCIFCTHFSSSMENLYEQGGWFTGTKPEVHSSIIRRTKGGYLTTLLMNFSEGTGYASDGAVAAGGNAEAALQDPWIAEMEFDSTRGHWVITSMDFKGEGSQ